MRLAPLLLVAVAVACSNPPPRPPPTPPAPRPAPAPVCAATRWGGWDGTKVCAEAAARVIAGADRTCAIDLDCVRMTPGNCNDNIVSETAEPGYRFWPAACADPTAGDCGPSHPACIDGCCASVAD